MEQLFRPMLFAKGERLDRAVVNAPVTVLTFVATPLRIAFAVYHYRIVRAILGTDAAAGTTISMQIDVKGGVLSNQLIRRVKDTAQTKPGYVGCYFSSLQQLQVSFTVYTHFFFQPILKPEKPLHRRDNQRAITGRAPVLPGHDRHNVLLQKLLCQNAVGVA